METLEQITDKTSLNIHLGLTSLIERRDSVVIRRETARRRGLTLILLRGPLFVDVILAYSNEGIYETGGRDMIMAYDVPTLMRQFDITTTQAKKLATKIDTL